MFFYFFIFLIWYVIGCLSHLILQGKIHNVKYINLFNMFLFGWLGLVVTIVVIILYLDSFDFKIKNPFYKN